jgi:tritrans,polycis-undecaprenyl-diphosphate synthase [geranylgeranyl-diphosphate specific]
MTVPKHIGIILDGNRRFAKRLMLKPWKGHEFGAKKVEKLFDWCKQFDIRELTLYAFSLENFNRPRKEFDYLMNLFKKEFRNILNDSRLQSDGIRIRFIGKLELLPDDLHNLMDEIMMNTKGNVRYTVNFAIAYSGRQEVLDAVKRLNEKIISGRIDRNEIDEAGFLSELYLDAEPDLIIRTGGEKRTSGFLLYQGSYAELYFSDKMWPEFEKEDFLEAINDYAMRERRFGK